MSYNIRRIEKKDFEEVGATDEELEGVAGFLSNLSDANTLLFLRELPDGRIKGSFRSMQEGIDISKLAQILGGGGHPRASAFMMNANLKKTIKGWKIK
jgi:phosphoesterase RecJ-like protein